MRTEMANERATPLRGVLIVGHGTQDERGRREAEELREQVAALRSDDAVELCFLEDAEPSIERGIARLAERGVRTMKVTPLLLFSAGHLQRDVPAAVASAAARHDGLAWEIAPALIDNTRLIELSAQRFRAAAAGAPPAETALVMVGRGSAEPAATAQIHRMARLRQQQASLPWCQVGFLALAEPRLAEVLARASHQRARRVIVQPHLLFQGRLLERVHEETSRAAQACPEKAWIVAQHLGPSPLLAEALLDNAHL